MKGKSTRKPVKTVPAKAPHSLKDKREDGIPFGDSPIRVPPIEELAAKEDGYDAQLAYVLSVISTWAYATRRRWRRSSVITGFVGHAFAECR